MMGSSNGVDQGNNNTQANDLQAITVAIDQYAEKALGNRDYFLNKPYGVG
jgi:hypothetical protein